jgi:hypothetical protein
MGPQTTGTSDPQGVALTPFSEPVAYLCCSMQGDGNLVLYTVATGQPLWASNTATPNPGQCFIQSDGNLVLYTTAGDAYWATGTDGKGVAPYKLVLQVR